MFLSRYSRPTAVPRQLLTVLYASAVATRQTPNPRFRRGFRTTRKLDVVVPVKLADIGEGIVECEIIQWFVEPGARVEQFSPLCEVQSDKASSEISSKYDGVVKKLYYEPGEMARVGKAFVDIDTDDVSAPSPSTPTAAPQPSPPSSPAQRSGELTANAEVVSASTIMADSTVGNGSSAAPGTLRTPGVNVVDRSKNATLAVPSVRHLCKTHDLNISLISGTGKGGRVSKADVLSFIAQQKASTSTGAGQSSTSPATSPVFTQQQQVETSQALTPTQLQMFKTMTRSLTIPHFLYADEVDFSELTMLRSRLNKVLPSQGGGQAAVDKLSYLPFIVKAVSLALYQYPILNARVDKPDTNGGNGKPVLVHRSLHNIGVAMDTPGGLVVPVIRDVASRNLLSIASELVRLQKAAMAGKLSPADMAGGTLTVSNIGNIGGTYVSPVIVEREVAILGIGRMRTVPAFDDDGSIVKKQVTNFSWSADHRVVDGATMARAAEVVRKIVEEPDVMLLHLR